MPRELRDYQMTIRIPTRLYQALEKQADVERRSIADVVNNVLEKVYPRPERPR
jgi:hypothetical protein